MHPIPSHPLKVMQTGLTKTDTEAFAGMLKGHQSKSNVRTSG